MNLEVFILLIFRVTRWSSALQRLWLSGLLLFSSLSGFLFLPSYRFWCVVRWTPCQSLTINESALRTADFGAHRTVVCIGCSITERIMKGEKHTHAHCKSLPVLWQSSSFFSAMIPFLLPCSSLVYQKMSNPTPNWRIFYRPDVNLFDGICILSTKERERERERGSGCYQWWRLFRDGVTFF